jgi:putative membrane protein
MMGGFGSMGLMSVFWVLILGLIIWAVIALARGVGQPASPDSGASDSALNVLKKRYAHGDINKDEYEEKKKDLL